MIGKVVRNNWFGEVSEFEKIATGELNQSGEIVIVMKYLTEFQQGNFTNVEEVLQIGVDTKNCPLMEFCFKLFLATSSHAQIKECTPLIEKMIENSVSIDPELEHATNLASHIVLSQSKRIVDVFSKLCEDDENDIAYYIYDLVFDGDYDKIDDMHNCFDEIIKKAPNKYIYFGNIVDLNDEASGLVDYMKKMESSEYFQECLIEILAISSGIEPPFVIESVKPIVFTEEIIDKTKIFADKIKEKGFEKGKKYFYGHLID